MSKMGIVEVLEDFSILKILEEKEFRDTILSLIDEMRDPVSQIILIWRYYRGMSRPKIAKELGYKSGETIRIHEEKALTHLRRMLTRYYPEYCPKDGMGDIDYS